MTFRRSLVAFVAVAATHAALTLGLLVAGFGRTMARFDSGELLTVGERTLNASLQVLLFPLGQLALHVRASWMTGLLGYLPLLLNSALWAAVIVTGWRALHGRDA